MLYFLKQNKQKDLFLQSFQKSLFLGPDILHYFWTQKLTKSAINTPSIENVAHAPGEPHSNYYMFKLYCLNEK